ncbi:MAG: 30S ribosomal protein S2 [Bacteroidota bacterium]
MAELQRKDLISAGVHLGHLSQKWNPHMASFIFMESNGMHIIDVNKTLQQLKIASRKLQSIARNGQKILLVGTKKQAKSIIVREAQRLDMPYITERWLGGTLTNFITIRRLIKKMTSVERMMKSPAWQSMPKKEHLMIERDKAKLERLLKGVTELTRLPGAILVVDINREHIAVKEAKKLGIPVFALVDTNANPNLVDYSIPSNDDATQAIGLMLKVVGDAIEQGLTMREEDKKVASVQQPTTASEATPQAARKSSRVQKVASTESIVALQAGTRPTTDTMRARRTTRQVPGAKSTVPKEQLSRPTATEPTPTRKAPVPAQHTAKSPAEPTEDKLTKQPDDATSPVERAVEAVQDLAKTSGSEVESLANSTA